MMRILVFSRFVLFSTIFLLPVIPVVAFESETGVTMDADALEVSVHSGSVKAELPDDFVKNLDRLLHSWAIDRFDNREDCLSGSNPIISEEEYKERLKKLPHIIEMPYNSYVKSYIEVYTQQRRKQVEYMLALSSYYFPVFEEALEREKLPLELRYLPIIESSLNPRAVSRAGATGIWQFMPATGRAYGLEINSLVDERMDPEKSSRAAARFLKELYSIYSDWHLAIAAYNCGPGNVNKAINRAGGKKDYWAIYNFLPAETRAYVPIFIAANYAMSYAEEHKICSAKSRLPLMTDTIMVRERIHLKQVAEVLDLPIEELQLLNPQYRSDLIPGDIKPYPICLPYESVNSFISELDQIRAYEAELLVHNRRETVEPIRSAAAPGRVVFHTVRKGETLSGIAKRYGTTVRKIQNTNGLRSTRIRIGQRLRIQR